MLLGDRRVERLPAAAGPGRAEAFSGRAVRAGRASSIVVYVARRSRARELLAGLYTDARGHPGVRLSWGGLRSPVAGAWNRVRIRAVRLRAGRTYWIALLGEGGFLGLRVRERGLCERDRAGGARLTRLPYAWRGRRADRRCPASAYVQAPAPRATVPAGPPATVPAGPTAPAPPPATTPGPGTAAAPVNLGEPVISGTVAAGDVLSVSPGSWSGDPSSFSYQWQDCSASGTGCVSVAGARSSTYTVGTRDAGHTLEAVVTATNAQGSTAAAAPIVPLIDNFTSDATIDTHVWDELNQQGDTSNHEVECYLPAQLAIGGSRGLQETLQYVAGGFTCPPGTPLSSNPLHWESGAVQMRSVNFTYGTVVVRAKMAGGDGSWPAIWLLGAQCQQPTWLTAGPNQTGYDCQWPSDTADAAEIDIAEDLGATGTFDIHENVLSNSTNHSCFYDTGSDLSGTYHNYELDWSPGKLVFKVDGTPTRCGITGADVPSHPMFLIINTAVCTSGATCSGNPDPASFPQTTSILWAHVSH